MTLKSHSALCNANRAVLWLNGKSYRGSAMVPSDRTVVSSNHVSICSGLTAIVNEMFKAISGRISETLRDTV